MLIKLLPAADNMQTGEKSLIEPLTDRESDVLKLIISGQTNKEIAERLFISLNTVKGYIKSLYSKLHVQSRSQAIARARELNLE